MSLICFPDVILMNRQTYTGHGVLKSPLLLNTYSFDEAWRRELPASFALIFSCSWDLQSWKRYKEV